LAKKLMRGKRQVTSGHFGALGKLFSRPISMEDIYHDEKIVVEPDIVGKKCIYRSNGV